MNQSRTHNKANEINTSGITASTGDDWYDPTYDAVGNMLTGPRPSAPKDSNAAGRKFRHTFDAWNRLVKTEQSATNASSWSTLATYAYNGENQRITKVDVAASPDVQYDYYHNQQWQVVEVRKDSDADPYEQWLWHPYYIDAPAIRYYDSNTDGSGILDQYFTHDANFNVTAIVDNTGAVVERYEYDPYGMVTVLDANFANDSDGISDHANPITYCGYRSDVETGLYHVRHRYLDPGLGRWVTRDPIGYQSGSRNLYAYADGTVTRVRDPIGLATFDCRCDCSEWCGGYPDEGSRGLNEVESREWTPISAPTLAAAQTQCSQTCTARNLDGIVERRCTGTAVLPVSKSEPPFDPGELNHSALWAKLIESWGYPSQWTVNCVGYGLCQDKWIEPIQGPVTCESARQAMLSIEGVTASERNSRCPAGSYKIAVVVDEGHDIHVIRQSDDGKWVHKRGQYPPTNVDAGGEEISDPSGADVDYGPNNNYKDCIFYFCVPAQ